MGDRHLGENSAGPGRSGPLSLADLGLLLLLVLLALGAGLRLPGLGEIDFRGDEVTYFLDLQSGREPVEWLHSHFKQFGHDRQMPLPRVLGAFFVTSLGIEASAFSVRAPFAVAGILTVLAMWLFGWQLGRRLDPALDEAGVDAGEARHGSLALKLAAMAALFTAVNPYHLYWSRTAHIYVYPMLFLSLALAGAVGWARALERGEEMAPEGRRWLMTLVAGTVLAGYSHMSAWIAGFLIWLTVLALWAQKHWGGERRPGLWPWLRPGGSSDSSGPSPERPWPRALTFCFLAWGLSLASWAWSFLEGLLGSTYDAVWDDHTNPLTRFTAMWRTPFIMTWGGGWRSVLTLGLPTAAFWLGWRHPRFKTVVRGLAIALATLFVLLSAAQATGFFAVRYYTPLWPLLIIASAIGAHLLAETLRANPRLGPWLAAATLAVPALAMLPPVQALVEMRGNPVEFSRMAQALDETLAEGTPVVVNGMNVVLFEMRPHRPQSVMPTFTVPDVGLKQWTENRWRQETEAFFRRFPDAALVQQGRNYYEHPDVGPWDFPERFFARELVLRNEPALLLRRLLIGGSLDFFSQSPENSRSVIRILYNLPEDLVAQAQEQGRQEIVLFGEGWDYFKGQDLSSWRAFRDRAELIVHNLRPELTPLQVTVHGQAPTGVKEMTIEIADRDQSSEPLLTPPEGGITWRFTVPAQPGANSISLVDELYDVGRIPLLVSQIEVHPMDQK